jgi:hypothetical protein
MSRLSATVHEQTQSFQLYRHSITSYRSTVGYQLHEQTQSFQLYRLSVISYRCNLSATEHMFSFPGVQAQRRQRQEQFINYRNICRTFQLYRHITNSYKSKSSAAGTYVRLSSYRNRVVRDRNIFVRVEI